MEKVELYYNNDNEAISVMREVAEWGRNKGFRVWLDEWLTPRPSDEAVYLHKLCVKPEFAHKEMTKSVVEAIRNECRDKGVKYIRLDTGLDEKVVRKIYLRAGFKIVDIIDYNNGNSMALYEMEV